MPHFVTPFIVSLVLIAVLLVIVIQHTLNILINKRRSYRQHRVLRVSVDKIGTRPGKFLRSLKTPFVFEIAVPQLGNSINYYFIFPTRRAEMEINKIGAVEAKNYQIYHPGGTHVSGYFKGEGEWPEIDLDKIDFSQINDIGESALIQFVFHRQNNKRSVVNVRVMVSAPSQFQAKEIFGNLRDTFPKFKLVEASRPDFIGRIYKKQFSEQDLAVFNNNVDKL
jgi:hypothetical protein